MEKVMIVLDPIVECWGTPPPAGTEESLQFLEKCGRVCWKTEEKIGPDSAKPFLDRVLGHTPPHLAVWEMSWLAVELPGNFFKSKGFLKNPALAPMIYSKFIYHSVREDTTVFSGNIRAWWEWASEILYAIEPLEIYRTYDLVAEAFKHIFDIEIFQITNRNKMPIHLIPVVFSFLTHRSVTHEIVRHRPASFLQESQRYVKYQNVKFIRPVYDPSRSTPEYMEWWEACKESEQRYATARTQGMSAQKARLVLNNSVAAQIIVCATVRHWLWIFSLRCSSAADPAIIEIMEKAQALFVKETAK
jgi:thymidylate synthase (FAD)